MVSSDDWSTKVKTGTQIVLINSSHYLGLPAPPNSPRFAPTIPPILEPSTPTPPPAPLLERQNILAAKGQHRLPDCGDRVFMFWGDPGDSAGLEELDIFQNVRGRATPGQWCDLDGNAVQGGCVAAVDNPGVSIGLALAGRVAGLQDMRSKYVVIERSTFKIGHRMKDSGHLDGTSVYRWNVYPSRERAQAGLEEAIRSGFSIEANWAEVGSRNVSEISTLQGRFVGESIAARDHKFFAIISSRDKTE